MRLYDTAHQAVVDLELDNHVRMYVCGITPYDSTHLGHAATYLTYDLIIRRLEDLGHTVEMVRNVTRRRQHLAQGAGTWNRFLQLAEQEMNAWEDMDAQIYAAS